MDGLIKGLIDVALDVVGNDHDDDNRSGSQNRDERSRSTWAEVVSGEDDKVDEESSGRRSGHHRSQWNREEEKLGQTEEWEIAGSRPSRRPQKAVHEEYGKDEYGGQHANNQNYWNRKGEKEESNDGWETVGKKPARRPQRVYSYSLL